MLFLTQEKTKRGILIVDDDHDVVSALSRYLKKKGGYSNIYSAHDGNEGLDLMRQIGSKIYCVILDLKMPNMDGLTFFRHLINGIDFPVSVIIWTAYGSIENSTEFFKMGTSDVIAFDFIVKSIDLTSSNLLNDINHSLERVHERRIKQLDLQNQIIRKEIADLKPLITMPERIESLHSKIDVISKRHRGILADLGLDVFRVILFGLAVIFFLFFGIDDYIKKLIEALK